LQPRAGDVARQQSPVSPALRSSSCTHAFMHATDATRCGLQPARFNIRAVNRLRRVHPPFTPAGVHAPDAGAIRDVTGAQSTRWNTVYCLLS
jgi:hypothetical protein